MAFRRLSLGRFWGANAVASRLTLRCSGLATLAAERQRWMPRFRPLGVRLVRHAMLKRQGPGVATLQCIVRRTKKPRLRSILDLRVPVAALETGGAR